MLSGAKHLVFCHSRTRDSSASPQNDSCERSSRSKSVSRMRTLSSLCRSGHQVRALSSSQFPGGCKRFADSSDLVRRVRRSRAASKQAAAIRGRRRQNHIDIDPLVDEGVPQADRFFALLEPDCDNGTDFGTESESHLLQGLIEPPRIIPEPDTQFRLSSEAVQSGSGGRNHSRARRCGKNVRAASISNKLRLVMIRNTKSACGSQAFAERADDEIYAVFRIALLRKPAAALSQNSKRMGFVHKQIGAMLLFYRCDFGQRRAISQGAIDSFHDDQRVAPTIP